MERLENKTTCSLASFPGSSAWAESMRACEQGYLFPHKALQLLYIIVIVNAKQRMKINVIRPREKDHLFLYPQTRSLPWPYAPLPPSLLLGISPSSSKERLREAHKRIMLLNHPDRGGSPYLAAKINEAKDYLESGGKTTWEDTHSITWPHMHSTITSYVYSKLSFSSEVCHLT